MVYTLGMWFGCTFLKELTASGKLLQLKNDYLAPTLIFAQQQKKYAARKIGNSG
jgi:hypothetical protein